jgi:hypothetical protein
MIKVIELDKRRRADMKLEIWLFLVVTVLSVGCSSETREVVIQLEEQENSDQTGTATLRSEGNDQTLVTVNITPKRPSDEPQPVHVHFGRCGPNLGTVDKPLSDITNGRSETLVPLGISAMQDGDHAINVHKSYSEISVYTACASIPQD